METIIKIEGLSCSHCINTVEKILNEANGVLSATVSLPDKARVVFDETKTNLNNLKKLINDSEIYKAI